MFQVEYYGFAGLFCMHALCWCTARKYCGCVLQDNPNEAYQLEASVGGQAVQVGPAAHPARC